MTVPSPQSTSIRTRSIPESVALTFNENEVPSLISAGKLNVTYQAPEATPKENPAKVGTTLEQQPLSTSASQQWEFIKAANKSYYIRLKGSELYITASTSETNSNIVLQGKQDKALQLWRLVEQNPNM